MQTTARKKGKHIRLEIALIIVVAAVVAALVFSRFGGFGTGPSADTAEFAKFAQPVSEIAVPETSRIVALGEATHGNKEFQELKLDVFKAMVENYGVRAFALEGDFGGCGRLLISDPRRPFYYLFEPAGAGNQKVICPASGGKNGDSIFGTFRTKPKGRHWGNFVFWDYGDDVEHIDFESFEEMQAWFDKKVEELRNAGQLGWAELEKDGEIIFSWSRDDE